MLRFRSWMSLVGLGLLNFSGALPDENRLIVVS